MLTFVHVPLRLKEREHWPQGESSRYYWSLTRDRQIRSHRAAVSARGLTPKGHSSRMTLGLSYDLHCRSPDWNLMLTRSLTFATLVLFAVSVAAQNIPAKLGGSEGRRFGRQVHHKGGLLRYTSVASEASRTNGTSRPLRLSLSTLMAGCSPSTMPLRPGKRPTARRSSARSW